MFYRIKCRNDIIILYCYCMMWYRYCVFCQPRITSLYRSSSRWLLCPRLGSGRQIYWEDWNTLIFLRWVENVYWNWKTIRPLCKPTLIIFTCLMSLWILGQTGGLTRTKFMENSIRSARRFTFSRVRPSSSSADEYIIYSLIFAPSIIVNFKK